MKALDDDSSLVTLQVEGMTCTNCAAGIEKSLRKKGLQNVSVSFANHEVVFEPITSIPLREIKTEITKLGYQVLDQENSEKEKKGFSSLEIKFAISALLTLPLLAHMFLAFPILHHAIFQLSLSVPVMLIGWGYFGKSAFYALRNRMPNMDVLITIGSTAAFIYSLWGTWLYYGTSMIHHFLFYETSATIITLVLLGNVIEHRSLKQTGSALKELAALQPDFAKKLVSQNQKNTIITVPTSSIVSNDFIQADTGDRIVVDGIIENGEAWINEAHLTGEGEPILKQKGHKVSAGSLIDSGSITFVATNVGKNTVLSGIIDLVKKAQGEKPNIQKLGDKVSAVFVPVVIAIAILTFIIAYFIFNLNAQQALMNAIAVLVISCPCAMGLATPTAVSAGLGRAAKLGILVKNGNTIETFAQTKQIVFDKTGTLTTGVFSVQNFKIIDPDFNQNQVFEYALALAERSAHPIAKSLKNYLADKCQPADLYAIRELKGVGMSGKNQKDEELKLGSARLLESIDYEAFNLFLTINHKAIAAFYIEDETRKDAKEMIEAFQKNDIECILLSGDKKDRCEKIAKQLGINKVYSEQLPAQKLQILSELIKLKNTTMVGDGVNDAPALNLAHTGISLSEATQVAINAAQIVLLKPKSMMRLFQAWQLNKITYKTIKQNLFWAFFYNVVAIPLAAFGFLSPMIAAFSMAFSDVIVIGNSIWLKVKKINV